MTGPEPRTIRQASMVLRTPSRNREHRPSGLVQHPSARRLSLPNRSHRDPAPESLKPPAPIRLYSRWAESLSPHTWSVYRRAIACLHESGIPFMLGGGFAFAAFTGRWRNTKDIDFYIHPDDRARLIPQLASLGFADYYPQLAYDRKWIHRTIRSGAIVDIIWSMANQRAQVDALWFQRARKVTLRGEKLLVIPPEEFLWCKLYILQRDHCDWTDILNLLYALGPSLDWEHLLWRLEDDLPLLRALLHLYAWACPRAVLKLPAHLWSRLGMVPPRPAAARDPTRQRTRWLDSRRWFAALVPPGTRLEV
jgi:hypothetical protein